MPKCARRLAVIMHRIWVDGTDFRWTRVFAALALGLVLHGLTLLVAIGGGAWFRNPPLRIIAPPA